MKQKKIYVKIATNSIKLPTMQHLHMKVLTMCLGMFYDIQMGEKDIRTRKERSRPDIHIQIKVTAQSM